MLYRQAARLLRVLVVSAVISVWYSLPADAFSENKKTSPRKSSVRKTSQSRAPQNRSVVVKEVIVKVRAIKASNPNNLNQDETKAVYIDKRLDDLSTKLRGFDFRTFKMISEQELSVPVKKKTVINLTERTILTLRPVYSEDMKVGMWIKWEESSGNRTLLDTRMHFDTPDPMLAGTNCKDNKALILSISAVPK